MKDLKNPNYFVKSAEDKLEDLKVLKRSHDVLNNVKIGHGQLRLIIQTYFVLPCMGMVAILVKYHIYIC